jgi:ParB-like chromosome segregation protein Spo0J
MNFETISVADLSLDPSNVRKHSRRNLDAIKASLRKFGQQKPIVVDAKGIVLAGNGTLIAAQELGWTEIQIVRTELAGVEATAFAIADNRTAELAEWKQELNEALNDLVSQKVNLDDLGFDRDYIKELQKDVEIKEVEIKRPPKQAWFLIQLPFSDLAAVQSALDKLPDTTKTFSTFTD